MNIDSKFFNSSLKYLLGDIVLAVVSTIVILPFITNKLDNEEFGNYVFFKSVIELTSYVLIFGTITAYSKFHKELSSSEKDKNQFSILFNLILTAIILIIALSIIVDNPIWLFCIAAAGMTSIATLEGTRLRLEFQPSMFLLLQLASAVIFSILIIVAFPFVEKNLSFLILSLCVIYIPHLVKLIIRVKIKNLPKYQSHKDNTIRLVKFGFPILIGYLAFFSYQRAPIFFLKYFNNLEVLSKFGITQQLLLVIMLVSGSASKYYQPTMFQRRKGINNKETYIFLFIIFTVTSFVLAFGADLYSLLISDEFFFSNSENFLIILSGSIFSLRTIFDTQILLKGNSRHSMYSTLCGTALGLCILFWNRNDLNGMILGIALFLASLLILFTSVILSKIQGKINFEILIAIVIYISIQMIEQITELPITFLSFAVPIYFIHQSKIIENE